VTLSTVGGGIKLLKKGKKEKRRRGGRFSETDGFFRNVRPEKKER